MSTLIGQARTRIPRFADAAVERARLTVVPSRVQKAPRAPFVILVVLLLAGGVAGLLAFNTSMQQASFEATALETRAEALAAEQQSLSMELEHLRDPQRLATAAKALGMVPPTNPAFVRLSDGRILGEPMAATSMNGMRIIPLPALKPKVLAPKPKIVKVKAPPTKTKQHDASSADRAQKSDRKKPQRHGQGAIR